MTLQQFIEAYNNKPLNYDGKYGNQCMDLFRYYVRDVLNLPQFPGVRGAVDLPNVYDKTKFDFIKNSLFNQPKEGDIIIFKATKTNSFGHVSIYLSGNLLNFVSFDQNWPSQGYIDKNGDFIGTGVSHKQSHSYLKDNVLGWFHPKEQTMPEKTYTEAEMTAMRLERDKNYNLYQDQIKKTEGLVTSAKAEKDLYYQKELASALQTSEDNNFETLLAQVKRLKNESNYANEPIGNLEGKLPKTYNGYEIAAITLKP